MDHLEAAQDDELGICDSLGFSTEELAEQLQAKPDDPQVKERVEQWKEYVKTAMESLYPKDTCEYHVRLHMKTAILYSLAGRVEDANQAWYDAWYIADSSRQDALAEEVVREARKYGYEGNDEENT